MTTEPDMDQRRAVLQSRVGATALAFVLLTLLALVAIPAWVQGRVTSLRQEIVASEPTRSLITRLQVNLVRGLLIQNQRLIEGADTLTVRYDEILAEERALLADLAPLVATLDPQVRDTYDRLRALTDRWHARAAAADRAERRGARGVGLIDDPLDRQAFSDVLIAAADLDEVILGYTARVRDRIETAEDVGLRLTYLLGVLALVAAVFVAILWRQLQHFAAEAERGRSEAERQREAAEARSRETEEALAEVARANEGRARLLRGVTHDVKNPLGAAKGYAELLAMGVKAPLLPEQAPLVRGLERSIESALAILEDLLDLARSESGGLSIHPVPVDLRAVVREAIEVHRATAEASGHELRCETSDGALPVNTDPDRVRQVLGNLLSNALKYTPPPGRVVVATEAVSNEGGPLDGAWACVRIIDSGPGIPPEMRESIFEEFTRVDDRSTIRGHGLGLAIARRIARLLGGELLLADSGPGGSTFELWLPRQSATHPPPPRSTSSHGPSGRRLAAS